MIRSHIKNSLLHVLTPKPSNKALIQLQPYNIPDIPIISNHYHRKKSFNPHNQRSRKHRLKEQKNLQIQKNNRILYQRIRKIKLKNSYESEKYLQNEKSQQSNGIFVKTRNKPFSLPQVDRLEQFYSTKSQLKSILSNRSTFVGKYFEQLNDLKNKGLKRTEDLGKYLSNGWKIHALLIQNEHIVLVGRKQKRQLTKKYIYNRVKQKMIQGIQIWIKSKFEFER